MDQLRHYNPPLIRRDRYRRSLLSYSTIDIDRIFQLIKTRERNIARTGPNKLSPLLLTREAILITKLKQNKSNVTIKNASTISFLSTYKVYQSIPKESRYSATSFCITGGGAIISSVASTSFFLEIDFQSCTSIS